MLPRRLLSYMLVLLIVCWGAMRIADLQRHPILELLRWRDPITGVALDFGEADDGILTRRHLSHLLEFNDIFTQKGPVIAGLDIFQFGTPCLELDKRET